MKQVYHMVNYILLLSNKEAKGRKGTIEAILQGTQSDYITEFWTQHPFIYVNVLKRWLWIWQATWMQLCVAVFHAQLVIDRFHVQQLATEALQKSASATVGSHWGRQSSNWKRKSTKRSYHPEILVMVIPVETIISQVDTCYIKMKTIGH